MITFPFCPFLKWTVNRIEANKSVIVSVNGGSGTGKTYGAISKAVECATALKTNFSIKDNLDFNFAELLKKMQLPQNQKPGTPFIFEEVGSVGSGAASRLWQTQANRFCFSFMQTSRHRNQILFLTTPQFAFLEKGTRSMCHMQWETNRINYKKRLVYFKPYRIQVNSRTGKFYFKYLRVKYKGKRISFVEMSVPHPPQKMADEYEIAKLKFTTALNKEIIAAEERTEVNTGTSKPHTKDIAKARKYISNQSNNKLTNQEIAVLSNLSVRTIIRLKQSDK